MDRRKLRDHFNSFYGTEADWRKLAGLLDLDLVVVPGREGRYTSLLVVSARGERGDQRPLTEWEMDRWEETVGCFEPAGSSYVTVSVG